MFRKFRSFLNQFAISEDVYQEFNNSINAVNVARAKLTALLFVFLEILLLLFSVVFYRWDVLAQPRICYFCMYFVMLCAMLASYFTFKRIEKDVAAHEAEIRVLGVVFTVFVLCWCAGISTLDQMASGQILVYVFAIIAVAVMPYFRPSVALSIYLSVHAAFVIRLLAVSPHSQILTANIVNSTTFIAIAWFISAMRFKDRVAMFRGRKLVEQKNAELERVNLELQKANEKLSVLSRIDSLTGIANRLAFDTALKSEWLRCSRESLPLTLFMIDIDFFKGYNDHYGHQAGDECLRRIAGVLASFARRSYDTAARYGGEEFSLILPYMGKAEAETYSGEVIRGVEALKMPYAYSSVAPCVTISLGGCTVIPDGGNSAETLIGNADKALYEAKKRRNRAVMFSK